jgi:hypothetical protein
MNHGKQVKVALPKRFTNLHNGRNSKDQSRAHCPHVAKNLAWCCGTVSGIVTAPTQLNTI